MPSSEITQVSLFEIGKDAENWPIYRRRVDLDVEPGTYMERIGELAQGGQWPANAYIPDRTHRRPGRYLDIDETRNVGICLYAFLLSETFPGGPRQLFVGGRPFIPLPLNSEGDVETFLTDLQIHDGETRLLASFVCDLGALRGSRLATELRPTGSEPEHAHPRILNLPFCFNVVDPILKASPWVVPESSDDDPTHAHFFTHGGVHPSTVAFLSVAI